MIGVFGRFSRLSKNLVRNDLDSGIVADLTPLYGNVVFEIAAFVLAGRVVDAAVSRSVGVSPVSRLRRRVCNRRGDVVCGTIWVVLGIESNNVGVVRKIPSHRGSGVFDDWVDSSCCSRVDNSTAFNRDRRGRYMERAATTAEEFHDLITAAEVQ